VGGWKSGTRLNYLSGNERTMSHDQIVQPRGKVLITSMAKGPVAQTKREKVKEHHEEDPDVLEEARIGASYRVTW